MLLHWMHTRCSTGEAAGVAGFGFAESVDGTEGSIE